MKIETTNMVHVTLQIVIKQRFLHYLVIWAKLLFHAYSTVSKITKNIMLLQTIEPKFITLLHIFRMHTGRNPAQGRYHFGGMMYQTFVLWKH